MPKGKPKLKTAVMTLRVDPVVKAAAEAAARRDRRSVTSMIEVLVIRHCENAGIPVEEETSKEEKNER